MGASRSPHSSFSSPQVSVDSPRISFSPLHIKDSIEVGYKYVSEQFLVTNHPQEEEGELQYEPVTFRSQSLTVPGYCTPPTLSLHSGHSDHRDHHDPGARSPRGRAGHRSQLRWHSPGHNTLLPNPAQYSPRARSVSPISVSGRCGPSCVSCPRYSHIHILYLTTSERLILQVTGAWQLLWSLRAVLPSEVG